MLWGFPGFVIAVAVDSYRLARRKPLKADWPHDN